MITITNREGLFFFYRGRFPRSREGRTEIKMHETRNDLCDDFYHKSTSCRNEEGGGLLFTKFYLGSQD